MESFPARGAAHSVEEVCSGFEATATSPSVITAGISGQSVMPSLAMK
jgi:hypothetical protein